VRPVVLGHVTVRRDVEIGTALEDEPFDGVSVPVQNAGRLDRGVVRPVGESADPREELLPDALATRLELAPRVDGAFRRAFGRKPLGCAAAEALPDTNAIPRRRVARPTVTERVGTDVRGGRESTGKVVCTARWGRTYKAPGPFSRCKYV